MMKKYKYSIVKLNIEKEDQSIYFVVNKTNKLLEFDNKIPKININIFCNILWKIHLSNKSKIDLLNFLRVDDKELIKKITPSNFYLNDDNEIKFIKWIIQKYIKEELDVTCLECIFKNDKNMEKIENIWEEPWAHIHI